MLYTIAIWGNGMLGVFENDVLISNTTENMLCWLIQAHIPSGTSVSILYGQDAQDYRAKVNVGKPSLEEYCRSLVNNN